RGTDGARDGTRSLCQPSACHLVTDAGTSCPWRGVSVDNPASALRKGSCGITGYSRRHSPSGVIACGILHRRGLQTRQTCACTGADVLEWVGADEVGVL